MGARKVEIFERSGATGTIPDIRMRVFLHWVTATFLLLGAAGASQAQDSYPVTLEVDSGVRQFQINVIDADSVSVKLGAAYKFRFSKEEILSATSDVVGAAISNARILLNRAKGVDPSNLDRLAKDLDRSAKELANLDSAYKWLIPETTSTWALVDAAEGRVEGTRLALEAAQPHKRTVDSYLARGFPFPEDWKDIFDRANDALSKIPIEEIRESEIVVLSRKYERIEDLTSRQTERSLAQIEKLKTEIEELLASEKLTNGLWGQLNVGIDRRLNRIPKGESRSKAEQSLAPLFEEVESFLERNKEKLALEEIEERLASLEGLMEIVPASADTFSAEVALVSTLVAGLGESDAQRDFQSRISAFQERLEEAAKAQPEPSPTQPSPPPQVVAAPQPAREPPAPSLAPVQPVRPVQPEPVDQVPIYRNRNVLIVGGVSLCAILILAILGLLRKKRKGALQPSAPPSLLKEAPPAPEFAPQSVDDYAHEFSKPALSAPAPTPTEPEPKPESPSSPFPDLPAITEPAPTPTLYSEPPETTATEETGPSVSEVPSPTPQTEPAPDDLLGLSTQPEDSHVSETADGGETESPSAFPQLSDEQTPLLDSVFGEEPIEPASLEPEPSTPVEEPVTQPATDVATVEESPLEESPASEPASNLGSQESGRTIASSLDETPAPSEESPPLTETETPPVPSQIPEASAPSDTIELEPMVLEGRLVEFDGSESIERTGVRRRLDQGATFQGVRPGSLFPLGSALGLVGERSGKLELTILDREVDGSLVSRGVLLEAQNVYSVSSLFGVYCVLHSEGLTVYAKEENNLARIQSSGTEGKPGKGSEAEPFGIRHVYRPVHSVEDRLFYAHSSGGLECYRLPQDDEPRVVERLWSFPSSEDSRDLVSNAVPLGDRIAVVDSQRNLILVEPADGRVYWEGPLQDLYLPSSSPVVLTSLGNRLLYVRKTGEGGMSIADFTGPEAPTSSHPIVNCRAPSLFGMDDGILLVSESEIAFFEERGLVLSWSQSLEGLEPIDLSVDRSQIAVLVREPEGHTRVMVLGKNSGSILWETEADEAEMTRLAGIVVQDGNLLLWGESEKDEGILRLLE